MEEDETSNVLDLVKRDAVTEATVGNANVRTSGAGVATATAVGATPTTFRLGNGSLHAFKLDVDALEITANDANQLAYLY